MSTDDTRPLPAADDETPTRAIEPVAADEGEHTEQEQETAVVDVDPVDVTRPLPATDEPRPATPPLPASEPAGATRPLPVAEPPRPAPAPSAGPSAAPAPAPAPATPPGPELRVGTVVWGLVVAVLGIGIISFAWGARIDGGLALIVLLAGAGVALLVGSLVVAVRRPRRRDGHS